MLISLKLFYIFFKVGLFGFGGGYTILPMIFQEIQKFGIMSPNEFSDIVALSQMTPGPIAINAATYVGFKSSGLLGASAATLGVTMPSFIIILIVVAFLNRFKRSELAQDVLSGVRPATVGMIASAVVFFAEASIVKENFFSSRMFNNPLSQISIPAIIIFVISIFCSTRLKIGPIAMTLLAGLLGIFII